MYWYCGDSYCPIFASAARNPAEQSHSTERARPAERGPQHGPAERRRSSCLIKANKCSERVKSAARQATASLQFGTDGARLRFSKGGRHHPHLTVGCAIECTTTRASRRWPPSSTSSRPDRRIRPTSFAAAVHQAELVSERGLARGNASLQARDFVARLPTHFSEDRYRWQRGNTE